MLGNDWMEVDDDVGVIAVLELELLVLSPMGSNGR